MSASSVGDAPSQLKVTRQFYPRGDSTRKLQASSNGCAGGSNGGGKCSGGGSNGGGKCSR